MVSQSESAQEVTILYFVSSLGFDQRCFIIIIIITISINII